VSATHTIIVRNASGLHARPAARLVEEARRFEADISAEAGGRQASCKSLIAVMKLGVAAGTELTLHAEGPDERAAVERLVRLFDELLAEEGAGAAP
jgi:phosphotransferase system HPr (HPr) family protein